MITTTPVADVKNYILNAFARVGVLHDYYHEILHFEGFHLHGGSHGERLFLLGQ